MSPDKLLEHLIDRVNKKMGGNYITLHKIEVTDDDAFFKYEGRLRHTGSGRILKVCRSEIKVHYRFTTERLKEIALEKVCDELITMLLMLGADKFYKGKP